MSSRLVYDVFMALNRIPEVRLEKQPWWHFWPYRCDHYQCKAKAVANVRSQFGWRYCGPCWVKLAEAFDSADRADVAARECVECDLLGMANCSEHGWNEL